jgi:hypothetical protein
MGVEIAGVKKTAIDFQDLPESFSLNHVPDSLHGWEKGEFRRTSHQQFRVLLVRRHDGSVSGPVYAKRFLAHEVLARFQGRAVELLMQVVRDGAVNRFHLGIGQEFLVVPRNLVDGGEILRIPAGQVRTSGVKAIANGNQFGAGRHVRQVAPPRQRTGKLTPHQPAANQSKPYPSHNFPAAARRTLGTQCE